MTDYGVYTPTIKERVIIALVISAFLEVMGMLIYDIGFGIIALPALYPFAENKYKDHMAKKRRNNLRNQFRDVLYSLSSSFAVGDHMSYGMEKSIGALKEIHGAGTDMEEELSYMLRKIRETGEDEVYLWQEFGKRSGVEDIRDFAEVFSTCRDAGGSLVKTVDRAADILGEKIGVEAEISLMASQKVTEGRIVGIMPVFMILFMRLTSPSYMSVMYGTVMGRIVMTVSMAIALAAFIVTERVTKIEV